MVMKKDISKIFKPNDIRGVYGSELTDDLAYKFGRAFVFYFKTRNVVVGRDMRLSSPKLCKAFINGVIDQGANAVDIGLVSSDALYFATALLNIPGAMITASHNPSEYNGIKFSLAKAHPINGKKDLEVIKGLIEEDSFKDCKRGKIIKKNILDAYVRHVHSFVNLKNLKKMKVIVDAGNGMAGKFFPLVVKGLPIKVIPIDFKLDGRFPDHEANPSKRKNVLHLEAVMKKQGADFGVAFDGDFDRAVFVNEKAHRFDSSLVASLIIKSILEKKSNGKFVYNTVMSKVVPEVIKMYNGEAFREKVGHTFIKKKMREIKADFGAENSGHFYYKNNFYTDSAIITFLIVAELYSGYGGKFSDMMREFRKYRKIDEKSFKLRNKDGVLLKIEKYYSKKAVKVEHVDGLTLYFKDWWFNLRTSNTEPFVRLNLEAVNLKNMLEKKREVIKMIKKFD
ncbi:phosphomannomutase/phosphoglucomutase [Candidatus Pacearchaeota archaeon CG_4_10_14_0_2_um_filter_05_32_18]|nr:MAG: phosphomannomutase/phosphoglucomutase [Candidatus Pacearchaeota archaeon CG_4_10_14_0_2_um_filter_05_32_18]